MHRAAGRSLLGHVLHAAKALAPAEAVVVVGPGMEEVAAEARRRLSRRSGPRCRKTGWAPAMPCRWRKPHSRISRARVLVLYGDVPLIARGQPRGGWRTGGRSGMAVLGFEAANPHGYGRLIRNAGGHVIAIREELDASPEERAINLCNSGIIAIVVRAPLAAAARSATPMPRANTTSPTSWNSPRRRACPATGRSAPRRKWRASMTGCSSAGIEATLQDAYRRRAHAERRHADRARDGVLLRRHRDRPGRGDRPPCGVRPRRDGGGRR